jgi:hypothetical protein
MQTAFYGILTSLLLIPHTSVKITDTNTGTHTQPTTNAAGMFDVPFLDPGPYTVVFQATGFQSLIREVIQLQLDQTARVDAQLKGCAERSSSRSRRRPFRLGHGRG